MKKRNVIRNRRAEGVEPMDPPPKTQSVVDSHSGHWCGGREREVKSDIFLNRIIVTKLSCILVCLPRQKRKSK